MPSSNNIIQQHSCSFQPECNNRAVIGFIEQYFSNNLQAIVRPNKTATKTNDMPSPKKRKPENQLTGREKEKPPDIQITGRQKLEDNNPQTKNWIV